MKQCKYKRISTILKWYAVSLLLCTISLPPMMTTAQETKPGTLLILGDSIATGCSLPGYSSYGNPKAKTSWANYLTKRYAAEKHNFAVDGDATADLLEQINNNLYIHWAMDSADVICISIGGNNFLQALSRYADNPGAILNMDEDAKKVIHEAAYDLDNVFAECRRRNPTASILVQTLYDPFRYWTLQLPDGRTWGNVLGSYIDDYNSMLKEKVRANGFICVDVAEKFKTEGKQNWLYSSLSYGNFFDAFQNFDPHPTVEGHYAIYETYVDTANAVLAERLREKPVDSTATTATVSESTSTTEHTETTVSTTASKSRTTTIPSKTTVTTPSSIEKTTGVTATTVHQDEPDGAEKPNKTGAWWQYLLWIVLASVGISVLIILVCILFSMEKKR